MWLFTTHGFFGVVRARKNDGNATWLQNLKPNAFDQP